MQETPRSKEAMPPSKVSPAAMVWAALRTEVPEAAGMLPPEELPDARVAAPVVRGALEPELEPVLVLVLLLVVRPLLLLLSLELESEELESEESESLELESLESSSSLSELLESSSSLSLETSLTEPHEAQGLLLSLLLSPAETALP